LIVKGGSQHRNEFAFNSWAQEVKKRGVERETSYLAREGKKWQS